MENYKPKVVFLDLETAPNSGYTWGLYEQNVIEFIQQGYLLSFAYRWQGEKTVHAHALNEYPLFKRNKTDDRELAKELWNIFDKADIIVAHNGDQFDIKEANKFFIKAGLTPPSPYRTVDTKKVAKRYFRFNSNKLTHLGEYLGIGVKMETGGFGLWKRCMAGNVEAWKKMIRYNKQDVVLLEEIYNVLRPWISNHPDMGHSDVSCPNCGSHKCQKRGISRVRRGIKQRYQCECAAWFLGKVISKSNGKEKEARKEVGRKHLALAKAVACKGRKSA